MAKTTREIIPADLQPGDIVILSTAKRDDIEQRAAVITDMRHDAILYRPHFHIDSPDWTRPEHILDSGYGAIIPSRPLGPYGLRHIEVVGSSILHADISKR